MLAATNQMQGENEQQWKKVNENTYYISSWWVCAPLFSKSDPISDQKVLFSAPVFRPDLQNPYSFSETWPLGRNYVIIT